MAVTPASRRELLSLVRRVEARLRLIVDMLPDHSKYVRYRLALLADHLARVLARESGNPAGDD